MGTLESETRIIEATFCRFWSGVSRGAQSTTRLEGAGLCRSRQMHQIPGEGTCFQRAKSLLRVRRRRAPSLLLQSFHREHAQGVKNTCDVRGSNGCGIHATSPRGSHARSESSMKLLAMTLLDTPAMRAYAFKFWLSSAANKSNASARHGSSSSGMFFICA
jgi:hypothetical protein